MLTCLTPSLDTSKAQQDSRHRPEDSGRNVGLSLSRLQKNASMQMLVQYSHEGSYENAQLGDLQPPSHKQPSNQSGST